MKDFGVEDITEYCKPINPCQNGGSCIKTNNRRGYDCACKFGFVGYNCEQGEWNEFHTSYYFRLFEVKE